MTKVFGAYKNIRRHIIYIILAELCIQFINASFLLILNIYMSKQGYADYHIADFISYRFLGVLSLAFPLGLFIRGRRLKPFFLAAGTGLPAVSLLMLHAVEHHYDILLYASLTLWGVFFTCMQVTILPFILRNCEKETQSEAISLNYAMWSVSTIISGLAIYVLSGINPVLFDEKLLLQIFSVMGFGCVYFVWRITIPENTRETKGKRHDLKNFDWALIARALVPTLIIAVGAGLTIPFVNLFFFSVHGMDSDVFSFMGSVSAVFVTLCAVAVPYVKRTFGYNVAITYCQGFAVLALILMASTDFYEDWPFAAGFATFCFLLRQPLMNMAAPMTSELVMSYVGERNQEMVSALTSAIWSGSWYISARGFKLLRETGLDYGYIFMITAAIYAIGVIWYHLLIRDYHRKLEAGLIAA
jgi:hypothetical protein